MGVLRGSVKVVGLLLFTGCGQGILVPVDFQNTIFNPPGGPQSPAVLPLVGYSFNDGASATFGTPTLPFSIQSANPTILGPLSSVSNGMPYLFELSPPGATYGQLDLAFQVPPGTDPTQYSSMGIAMNLAAGLGPGTGPSCSGGSLSGAGGFTAEIVTNGPGYSSIIATNATNSEYNQNVVSPISASSAVVPCTGACSGNVIVVSFHDTQAGSASIYCSAISVYGASVVLNP